MSIFPEFAKGYDSTEDKGVRKFVDDFYFDVQAQNREYLTEASIDLRFEAGDQRVYNEVYSYPNATRQMFQFNRIKRIKNTVCGIQRRDKKSINATGRTNADSETADQFTKIFLWLDKSADLSEAISQAFEGAFITGLNFIQISLDYRNDPISGDIKFDVCPYNEFVIDPYFRKRDLSDCNALWKRTYMTKAEAASLIPDKADEIEELTTPHFDNKFQFMPENTLLNKNRIPYDEFYYRDYRDKINIVDTILGESQEWTGNEDDLKDFLKMHPQLEKDVTKIPTVKLAILVNGKVMFNGPNPLGIDEYPFVGVYGYFTPSARELRIKIQGIVRGLRDAQFIYNRQKVAQFQMIENKPRPRFIYKPDSLIDKNAIYKLESGYSIGIKKTAKLEDIREVATQDEVSQSNIALTQQIAQEIDQNAGLNEEILGTASDDKAALLAKRRWNASLLNLQVIFSQLDTSIGQLGKILLSVIQKNFTPGKVKQIVNTEPTIQFYNKIFSRYDIVIEEGFDTSTQRQAQLAELLHLREIGVKIPDEALINAAVIQNKKELIEMMNQEKEQAMQMEQQRNQANMQEQQATSNMINAKAESERALAEKHKTSATTDLYSILDKSKESSRADQKLDMETIELLEKLKEFDVEKLEALTTLSKMLRDVREQQTQDSMLQQG